MNPGSEKSQKSKKSYSNLFLKFSKSKSRWSYYSCWRKICMRPASPVLKDDEKSVRLHHDPSWQTQLMSSGASLYLLSPEPITEKNPHAPRSHKGPAPSADSLSRQPRLGVNWPRELMRRWLFAAAITFFIIRILQWRADWCFLLGVGSRPAGNFFPTAPCALSVEPRRMDRYAHSSSTLCRSHALHSRVDGRREPTHRLVEMVHAAGCCRLSLDAGWITTSYHDTLS